MDESTAYGKLLILLSRDDYFPDISECWDILIQPLLNGRIRSAIAQYLETGSLRTNTCETQLGILGLDDMELIRNKW